MPVGDRFVRYPVKVKMEMAKAQAKSIGLRVTATTGGQHVPGSLHYQGRAIDVAGTPAQMARFYRWGAKFAGKGVNELFYDPLGAYDHGRPIPPIGGHSDHVHIGFDPPKARA